MPKNALPLPWHSVTICTQNRTEMFSMVKNGNMVLNENGRIVNQIWINIPKHVENVDLDEFVIMPNHVHGIIHIVAGAKHFYRINHSKHVSGDLNASPQRLRGKTIPDCKGKAFQTHEIVK